MLPEDKEHHSRRPTFNNSTLKCD
jgi:hypothetical protein